MTERSIFRREAICQTTAKIYFYLFNQGKQQMSKMAIKLIEIHDLVECYSLKVCTIFRLQAQAESFNQEKIRYIIKQFLCRISIMDD